jgi:hypothetical protein
MSNIFQQHLSRKKMTSSWLLIGDSLLRNFTELKEIVIYKDVEKKLNSAKKNHALIVELVPT